MIAWAGRIERGIERYVARWSVRARFVTGTLVLLLVSWVAMGADLWSFERLPAHRFTSMSILTGTWRLRSALSTMGPDEQVFDGAGYTNWGFGVPLLQAPFHAFARATGMAAHFFPDRAIYFFYFALMVPLLWAGFDRLLASRGALVGAPPRRHFLSWSVTLLTLCGTLFPLMSDRFLIYEETICYMVVFELVALAAYLFARPQWRDLHVVVLAVAAGIALLVRPTGLVLLGAWWAVVALESRRLRSIVVFTTVVAPFVGLWLWTNRLRSGSPVALGFSNGLPFYSYSVLNQRFGSPCVDTAGHFLQAAVRDFEGIFFLTPDAEGWMKQCNLEFELRPGDGWIYPNEGFLGLPVLAVLLVVALAAVRERCWPRRLSRLVPLLAMAAMFVSYVRAGAPVAWRYAADFWPLIVLAVVQTAETIHGRAERLFAPPVGVGALVLAVFTFLRHVVPSVGGLEILPASDAARLWDDFSRSRWSRDPAMPSRISCGDAPTLPYENGFGWTPFCEVGEVTNVYLGVPEESGDDRVLRFDAPGSTRPTLRVFVNGTIYEASRTGTVYSAHVHVATAALHSPVVMVTIEWTRDYQTPWSIALRSIELG